MNIVVDAPSKEVEKRFGKPYLFALRLDRREDMTPAEVWIFAQENCITVLSETGEKSYPIHDGTLEWEEFMSGGRLVYHSPEGEILLGCATNSCRDSVFAFQHYLEALQNGETPELREEDKKENRFCPVCGLRYPDKNRKICPKCMDKGQLFRRFFGFFGRYRAKLILSLSALALMTVAAIVAPYFSSGFFYDEVIYGDGKFAGALVTVLLLILGTRVVKEITTVVHNIVTTRIAGDVVFDLKRTIYGSIEKLSLSFFTGRQTGGLMTQVNEDADTTYRFFCDDVPYLILNSVKILALLVILMVMNFPLTVASLFILPLFVWILTKLYRRERLYHARQFRASSTVNSFLSDSFSGVRVVKAFAGEKQENQRFDDKVRKLAFWSKKITMFNATTYRFTYLLLRIAVAITWGLGGYMVMSKTGNMTYGSLLTFLAYINMIFDPLEFFVGFFGETADTTNAMQRLFEIMDAKPEIEEKPNALSPEHLQGDVDFSHVTFSYRQGKRVLKDVSFHVSENHTLGIVGHTGAGKSTLVNLLMRLYDCDSGSITVGGYDVKDLSLKTLHDHIAMVSQETYLFMGSILDNIRYAKPSATLEEVMQASRLAGAHDFIMSFPDGYNTKVGVGNQDLSGGERQRISIARAILKNPDILILDEATAAMDTATERYIQSALAKLTKGKTTIMIAHRLSTLKDADSLVVIEHGKVAEAGTHKELLEQKGVYHRLYTLQQKALQSAGILEE